MKKKHFLVYILILPVILFFGYKGSKLFLNHFNFAFIFYTPGQTLTLQTHSIQSEPLPLLPDRQVKNIILFIGDGMGLGHLTAARAHLLGPDGRFNIERMPVTGLVAIHSIDDLITDSAASATALSTGIKTKNASIAVDANGKAHPTILEAARDTGLSTGLVTSTNLTDATPAAFASHVSKRAMKAEIALQLIRSRVNVLFGEGEYFYPKTDARSLRKDDEDPIALAKQVGYAVINNKDELRNSNSSFLLGIFEDITPDRMQLDLSSPVDTPSLAELTNKALEVLSRNEKGFFLMVEAEGMDIGSHANRPEYFTHHLKNFDDAVKAGIDFARQDEHTLVIVTADHETGGLNIIGGSQADKQIQLVWGTDRHTGQPVPLFAFGPHAMRFTGLKDNTEIPKIMAELLGIKNFLGNE